jgi:hypothetical protein
MDINKNMLITININKTIIVQVWLNYIVNK